MAPTFHKHDDATGGDAAPAAPARPPVEDTVARLAALALPQRAAEVLATAFTAGYEPGGTGVQDVDGAAGECYDVPEATVSMRSRRPPPSSSSTTWWPRGSRCWSTPV